MINPFLSARSQLLQDILDPAERLSLMLLWLTKLLNLGAVHEGVYPELNLFPLKIDSFQDASELHHLWIHQDLLCTI